MLPTANLSGLPCEVAQSETPCAPLVSRYYERAMTADADADLDFAMLDLPGAKPQAVLPECDKVQKAQYNANWRARELGDLETPSGEVR